MTDTPNERIEPPLNASVGATVELDEVGDDILYEHGKIRDDLMPGQRGVIVAGPALEEVALWDVRIGNGELVALFAHEFTVVKEAPVNNPALYSSPLPLFDAPAPLVAPATGNADAGWEKARDEAERDGLDLRRLR